MQRFGLGWVLGFAIGCGSSPPPPAPPPVAVDLATLTSARVVDASEYLATLRSRAAATLQPQVDGQITRIAVVPGQQVARGQALIEIDPGHQPAAVKQAVASRASRQAALDLAEINLARVKHLVDDGALARQELDNARAAAESARADVQALGEQITSNRVDLKYYKIVAPEAGIVGDIPARVGDRVTTQSVLTTVTDNTTLEANISIPIERSHDVAIGTAVELADPSGRTIGHGTVKFVSAQVNADTQAILLKADIPNPDGALRSDQLVRARVVWRTHDGVAIPAAAVTRLGGQAFVYVAVAGTTPDQPRLVARQRPVELGDLANNTYVVASGVQAGDRIVTSNLQKLRDGAPIQQAPAQPPHQG